ncbi:septum formation family protein [Streptomyces griseoluteus]
MASLVTGILCCLPGVGLLLGLVALLQIRGRGQRGRAAAVVGSTLSGMGLALAVLLPTTGAAGWMWQGVKDGMRESVNLSLAEGDCFDTGSGGLRGAVHGVHTVPCASAHEAEVLGTFTLGDGPYPGEEAVRDAAERCVDLGDSYAMDAWAVPADVDIFHLTPSRESWLLGDRTVTCVFGGVTGHGTRTGSLRADRTTLDAHQVAYLQGAHALNEALGSEPDADLVEDDLPGHKAWAHRVSTALATWSRTLRAHPWPAAARAPLADLATRLDKARARWDEAARATDADAFYVAYDAGSALIDPEADIPARASLKLATTPPGSASPGADDGAADGGAKV